MEKTRHVYVDFIEGNTLQTPKLKKKKGKVKKKVNPNEPKPVSISRRYEDRVGVVFASGPSLDEETVEKIRPFHESGKVIAFGCNDTYRLVPYLDEFYACDKHWWDYHKDRFFDMRDMDRARLWTQDGATAESLGINYIKGRYSNKGLSQDPALIHFGSNSGFQLLNIAMLMGIRKAILVGYNLQKVDNVSHFFGDHPGKLNKNSPYEKFRDAFKQIKDAQKEMIVNCTPRTALKSIRKADLLEELNSL
jgi:hypothetical protein